jgi:glycosyltransferase involved in cell wall biosynthesis
MIDFSPSPLLIILAVAALGLLVQLYYFLFTFLKVSIYKPLPVPANFPPVSVVICARNEAERLEKFLPLVLEQDYPDFEVVVVNDCSWDNSEDLLEAFALQHKHLKVANIKFVEKHEHGKKFALTIGIKAAINDVLLLTDADCYPTSNQWIKQMMHGQVVNKEIVLAYGKYEKQNSLLNTFIRFDAFFIAVQFLGNALKGNTYMGVGRNLSYKRELFFVAKGFASHMHLLSGDDDLFINEVATKNNVAVVINKDAFTVSLPKQTWKDWFRQKKRHHSTAKHYKSTHKQTLIGYPFSWLLFHAAIITGLILQYNVLILIGLYFLRVCIQIAILHTAARKLNETDLGWKAPLLEFIQLVFINPVYFFSTFFVKKTKWM